MFTFWLPVEDMFFFAGGQPCAKRVAAEEEFNRFLRTVRIFSVNREFVEKAENSFWAMAVEYLNSKAPKGSVGPGSGQSKKVDYRFLAMLP
jgi:hypothetical protein